MTYKMEYGIMYFYISNIFQQFLKTAAYRENILILKIKYITDSELLFGFIQIFQKAIEKRETCKVH